jgi:hypothetical protein
MMEARMESSAARRGDARVAILGLVLAATSALPLSPDGQSFVQHAWAAFGRGALEGLLMVAGFGSPFLFGLAVALATRWAPDVIAPRLVRTPIAMMHSQLLLVSWAVWRFGDAVAAFPMFGFALVSSVYFVWSSARVRAEGEGTGPSVAWLVRWGAMIVAAVCMWARIQMFGVVKLGVAIDVAWLCAAGMILLLRRPPARPVSH